MPTTFGYVRQSLVPQHPEHKIQLQTLQDFHDDVMRPAGFRGGEVFSEGFDVGHLPLSQRPAGSDMLDRIQHGDAVLCCNLALISASPSDAARLVNDLTDRGCKLYVVDWVTASGEAIDVTALNEVVRLVAALHRDCHRECVLLSHLALRKRGGWVNAIKPWGFRLVRRKGQGITLAPDPKERMLMRRIVHLHDVERLEFCRISTIIRREGHRRNGKRVTPKMTRYGYHREKLLQAWEQQAERAE